MTSVRLELPEGVYDRARATAFFDQVAQGRARSRCRRRRLLCTIRFTIQERHGISSPGPGSTAGADGLVHHVSAEYLRALDVPLRSGRYFNAADVERESVIVNEAMARQYRPNENPVGKTFLTPAPRAGERNGDARDCRRRRRCEPDAVDHGPAMFHQATRPGSDVYGFISRDPRASQAPVLLIRGTIDVVQAISRIAARLD